MPKNNSTTTIHFLFGLRKVSPKLLGLMATSQVLFAVLTTTIAPLFVSSLLVNITNGSATLNSSAWLLFGYALILFFGDVVMIRISIALAFITQTKMQSHVAKKVLRQLSKRSLGYHANRMTGGTISDATKLTGSIERFWDTVMFTGVPIVTTVIAVCIALSFIFWQYAVILLALSSIVIFLIVRAQSAIAPASQRVAETSSAMTAHLADVVSNIASVKAFAQEENELAAYQSLIDQWRKSTFVEMKKVLLMTGSFGVMMTILNIAAFLAAVFATQYHVANVGVIYLTISYTLNVVMQLWSVSSLTRNYIRIIGDASPMIVALHETIEIQDPAHPEPPRISAGTISFNSINFTHEESPGTLFQDFLLQIPSGERVGIVGHSGSGKTTLTRILLRFSDIDSGEITIDGQNITAITQQALHEKIAYVAQEPMLFHRTLRENIAYGKPNSTDKEIITAAAKAHAMEFIATMPQGLDTIVGERGVKLSGGQRQRIAIARAILKDAPILILDEATSALDSESEKLIQDSLEKLMKGRTSIVIAHRLSTIAKLDRIIVLDHGRIVEDGTHADLLKHNGVYASLWSHQSGGFIEE